jgi:hypothetical protein
MFHEEIVRGCARPRNGKTACAVDGSGALQRCFPSIDVAAVLCIGQWSYTGSAIGSRLIATGVPHVNLHAICSARCIRKQYLLTMQMVAHGTSPLLLEPLYCFVPTISQVEERHQQSFHSSGDKRALSAMCATLTSYLHLLFHQRTQNEAVASQGVHSKRHDHETTRLDSRSPTNVSDS